MQLLDMGHSPRSKVLRFCAGAMTISAVGVVVVPLGLAIIESDDRFRLSARFAERTLHCLESVVTWETLGRSVTLAIAAALFGILFVSCFLTLARRSLAVFPLLFFIYAVDPTTRARAYRYLFDTVVPVREIIPVAADVLMTFIIPAVVLAFQYAPILLLLRLLEPVQKPPFPSLSSVHLLIFVRLPANFQRFSFEFALFFMAALFDPWLVRVVTGAKVNYWGPLLTHRAIDSRDLPAAATMLLIGLVVVIAAFYAARLFIAVLTNLWLRLSPLKFPAFAELLPPKIAGTLGLMLTGSPLVIALWPLSVVLTRAAPLLWRRDFTAPALSGELRAIVITALLSSFCSVVCVLAGLMLLMAGRAHLVSFTKARSGAAILALAPEGAFLLLTAMLTASGLLSPGFLLTLGVILSFGIPIAFLCWDSVLTGRERLKLELPSLALQYRIVSPVLLSARELLSVGLGIALLLSWLVADDVILLDFVASPGNKPFSPVMFGSALRGISDAEAYWVGASCFARMVIMSCIAAPLLGVEARMGRDRSTQMVR
jgi:hypothetical protein